MVSFPVRCISAGFADVEVQLGKVLSLPRAILVLPDPRAVEEVRSLEVCSAGGWLCVVCVEGGGHDGPLTYCT